VLLPASSIRGHRTHPTSWFTPTHGPLLRLTPPSSAVSTPSESTRILHLVRNTDRTHPSALSFLTSRGALDNAGSWAALPDGDRAAVKAKYAAAGVKLIVSAFGSTETPTSSGLDPIGAATTMGNWVKQYGLDGIDVDYEVKTSHSPPPIETWLTI